MTVRVWCIVGKVRPVYTCAHAASVIMNDGNQIRRRARTNSSGPNTNNVQNSYTARVIALTSIQFNSIHFILSREIANRQH